MIELADYDDEADVIDNNGVDERITVYNSRTEVYISALIRLFTFGYIRTKNGFSRLHSAFSFVIPDI